MKITPGAKIFEDHHYRETKNELLQVKCNSTVVVMHWYCDSIVVGLRLYCNTLLLLY
jgi:hypothetical protein